MALELAGRNPAKFTYKDGVSETTVTIQPDDDPDTVRAKLQRVLELEGTPAGLTVQQALEVRQQLLRAEVPPTFTPADRAAEDARMAGVQTMGWNDDAGDGMADLPEV